MYVIAFLDRSNVSFAQQEFEADFGISAAAYAFGAGLFFVGYAIFEIPSNLLLHKVGARWWLARIMVSWGIVAAGLRVRAGSDQLLHPALPARRHRGRLLPRRHPLPHLLGPRPAPEPGPRLLLHGHRARRHLGQPAVRRSAGARTASLGLRGIQWMFLVEGLLAVVVGIWAYFYLTDKPEGRDVVARRPAAGVGGDHRRPRTPPRRKATGRRRCWPRSANWRVWYFALIYFCLQIAVYGVTFFLPTQVTAITGQKLGFQSSLVTAIPWVFGLVGLLIFPGLADRTRKHRLIGSALLLGTGIRHHHFGCAQQ